MFLIGFYLLWMFLFTMPLFVNLPMISPIILIHHAVVNNFLQTNENPPP